MHVSPGIVTVTLALVVLAAAVVPLVIGSARRASDAYRLFASGVSVALVCLVFGLAGLLISRGEADALAAVLAVGMSLSGLLCCAALLRLPGIGGTRTAACRLLLDGLIIAAALWFAGWVLLTKPTQLLGAAMPAVDPATVLVTMTVTGSVGLALAVAIRVPRLHSRLLWLAAGVAATGGGGLALVAGLRQAGSGLAIAGAVLLVAALSVCVRSLGRSISLALLEPSEVQQDNTVIFVPVLAMVAFAMYHLFRQGEIDLYGALAASVQGIALVARQHLILRDVRLSADRLMQRESHFRELAHTDLLTGLANRRGLLHALRRSVELAEPCVLLGLDLDGFKNVNDLRGRDVGDAVLVEVGHRLRTVLHPNDLAVRLGGDEFAVLTRSTPAQAQQLAERLLEVLSLPFEQPTGRVFLSVSIGLAGDGGMVEPELLLRNTDLALRHAKQRGKSRVERYDVTFDNLLVRRTRLEHELRGAIEREELRLAFQPVAAVPSARPVGAEALLRWRHPELGSVRPDEFIPLAEECGMIAKLGAWVLQEACRHLARWLAAGHDVWLSVNVSPRELHAPEYVDQVAEALRAYNVPPQRLVLEVTEHAVATDLNELIRRLVALRLTGVRIALDDFGAGYSSLGQLRRLPIDILKIDHSLVAEHEPVCPADQDGPAYAPMVDIVMRLGHQLGLEVIAEGVTSPTELAAVVAAGCRFGQGQLFGWGVPGEHLEAMLEASTSPVAVHVPQAPPSACPLESQSAGSGEGPLNAC